MEHSGFAKSSEAEQRLMPPERTGCGIWPWLGLLAVLVVVLVLRLVWQSPPERLGEDHPALGTRLTSFHLEPLTGDSPPVSENDLDGKLTLVNFWGPWCAPCALEFPHLVELERHFRSAAGFQFFSVSSNQNPFDETGLVEETRQFLKEQQAEFPAYRDPQHKTASDLVDAAKVDHFGYPTTVLIGPDRTIRGLWMGYMPGDEDAVRLAIEKALRGASEKKS
jgi:cytochrome c biogenesis protein CcmG, thiol:disulfide interchange protein DsbE